MRTAATIAALALTLAAGACAGPKTQEFTKDDAAAIRQANAELVTAVKAKDMDTVLALYAENSAFMPPNAPMLRGKEPLKAYFDGLFSKGAELQMEVEEVAGVGALGYESGSYTVNYPADGSRDRGKYLRLLRNVNGAWRVEKTIWSSDLPKPAGAAAN
jgi:ketosteroid isomerase-like protein